jgi:hypothetical protein
MNSTGGGLNSNISMSLPPNIDLTH